MEPYLRPAFFGELQVDHGGGEVNQFTGMVEGKVGGGLDAESGEDGVVGGLDPTGGGDVDGLEFGFDAVFVFESGGNDVELEDADGAEDDVVSGQGPEYLGCPFFAEFVEAFVEGFDAQGVGEPRAPEYFGGEVGDAGEG